MVLERRRSARVAALWSMALPSTVLLLAASSEVTLKSATWFGVRGPVCPLGWALGECACPGCGLTRSTAMVAQGRFGEALALNPAGFVVVGLCASALALHADVLRRSRVLDAHLSLRHVGRWVFGVGVVVAWAMRGMGWFTT